MKLGKTFLFLTSILFAFLVAGNAQAGGYSGGLWWQNCPATADFPAVSGDTNGSSYQSGFKPTFITGTLSLDHLAVGATDAGGTSLECHYAATAVGDVLTIKSPPAFSACRPTGSFGWFQCHQ